MPDNEFDDDDGTNDYFEMLKAVIGGLHLLVNTLMGTPSTGSRPLPRNNGGHARTERRPAACVQPDHR
ncbi:hypothetical protein [Mycobacterium syngnathidarum]|uniref:hypothetical protein n=1 Tax=Mycobacterium syngnathidarum TaxID=1908205 RepID=UPI001F613337|nr:hypothetical protein [Mycobacterium syngnathidarum]